MAIQRWEMLLSAQADCYLLKIQGDREDVDKILQAHPNTCQNLQEISEDVFQWVIFVMDAPMAERLAIQNKVMSLTKDTSGATPSDELVSILDGLSGALQDLTNLTEDEHAFVMKKMARMGAPAAPAPTGLPQPPAKVPGPGPAPVKPPSPGVYPPAGNPLPRVTIPGRPGTPMPSHTTSTPAGPTPVTPSYPGPGTPLPSPGPLPNIVRPVQPPKSFPGAPNMPGTPMPSVPMPKITPPPMPVPKPTISAVAPIPIPTPQVQHAPPKPAVEKVATPLPIPVQIPQKAPPPTAPVPIPTPPPTGLADLNPELKTLREIPLTPGVEPLAYTPPRAPAPAVPNLATPVLPATIPAEPPHPSATAPQPIKPEDNSILRISIFYPVGLEPVMDQFLKTLIDVAQKKSKRPTAFQVALSVPATISLENSTEWIWKAKTSGSDIFFVILPEGLGSEIMDPIVGEAQAAGLRCFLIPQNEVTSKLLYMDLMVELMMFKRRIRPAP